MSKEGIFNFVFDDDLFNGTGTLKGTTKDHLNQKPVSLIPYYAWAHRNNGEMAVWLD